MNIGIGISLANYRPVPTAPLEDPDAAIAALFQTGTPGVYYEGAWYDPSDSTTVFQDTAGTTPAGVGDPVGLILDKSQGLATDNSGTAASSYTNYGWDVLTPDGSGGFSATKITAGGNDYANTQETFNIVAGEVYRVTFTVTASTLTTFQCSFGNTTNPRSNSATFSGTGTKTAYLTVSTTQIGAQFRIHTPHLGSITVTGASWERVAGNHATQTTSSARPVLQQSGDLYYLDFDGVDDFIATTFASAQAQPNSIGVGFKFDTYEAAGAADFVYDGVTGARHYLFNTASNIYAGAQNGVNYLVAASDLSSKVSLCSYNTTNSSTRINGVVSGGTGNVGTDNWGGISLGAWANGTSYKLDGRIYSFVGVNRTLTAAEITSVETYLAAKSGVTL